jgi:hypothetical protein
MHRNLSHRTITIIRNTINNTTINITINNITNHNITINITNGTLNITINITNGTINTTNIAYFPYPYGQPAAHCCPGWHVAFRQKPAQAPCSAVDTTGVCCLLSVVCCLLSAL